MVRIPQWQRQAGTPGRLPTIRIPEAGPDAFGAAGGRASRDLASTIIRERRQAAEAEDRQVAAFYEQQVRDILNDESWGENGLMYMRGEALLDDETGEAPRRRQVQERIRNLVGALSPAQREIAGPRIDAVYGSWSTNIDRHRGTEEMAYRVGLLGSDIDSRINDAMLNALASDDPMGYLAMTEASLVDRVGGFVKDYGYLIGGERQADFAKRRVDEALGELHSRFINHALQSQRPDVAAQAMEQFGERIDPTARSRTAAVIRDSLDSAHAATLSTQALAPALAALPDLLTAEGSAAAGGMTPERLREQAAGQYDAWAREAGVSDEQRREGKKALRKEFDDELKAKREAQAAEYTAFSQRVLSGALRPQQLAAQMPQLRRQFNNDQLTDLRSVLDDASEAKVQERADRRFTSLERMAYSDDPEEVTAFLGLDLSAERFQLGPRYEQAVKLQQSMREEDYALRGGGRADEARIKLALREMGVETGTSASESDAVDERRFRDVVNAAVQEWERAHNGQRIGAIEHSNLLQRLMSNEVMLRSGQGAVELNGKRLGYARWQDVDLPTMRQIAPDAVKAAEWALHDDPERELTEANVQRTLLAWLRNGQPPAPEDIRALPAHPPTAPRELVNPGMPAWTDADFEAGDVVIPLDALISAGYGP